jgi:hypothetical protein
MEVRSLVPTHAITSRWEEDCLMRDGTMPFRLEKSIATSAVAQ